MNSCLYRGTVYHQRFTPVEHGFSYPLYLFCLDLDEVPILAQCLRGFDTRGFGCARMRRTDYLAPHHLPLKTAVLERMSQLAGQPLDGTILFIGQLRCFGLYFSPVNFYFLQQSGHFTHLLAEVSNTPWNERHSYLVSLEDQPLQDKAFHVSPFMPMKQKYRWHIEPPGRQLYLTIANIETEKIFEAGLHLVQEPLNQTSFNRVLHKTPIQSFTILRRIYWQAFKLWRKGVPFHGHPGVRDESRAGNTKA